MADSFATHSSGLDSPASKAFAVTPDDNTDLALATRAIYTGAGGSIALILVEDSVAVTFASLPAGMILPVRAARIKSTGTTATGIIGLA